MSLQFDVIVIGAGPAGMSAALRMHKLGLAVMVLDEQPALGGQIWRAVETVAPTAAGRMLGEEYRAGAELAARFRASGILYQPNTQVWQIEPGWKVFTSRAGHAEMLNAAQVVLATGAQERPTPFPGWTLPGVLPVGAAQILMKTSREIPAAPVWVVGSGPLPLLYMAQLLRAGGQIAGWLDTTQPGAWRRALPWTGAMLAGWGEVAKGLTWLREIKAAGVRRIRNVKSVRAVGDVRLEEVEYTLVNGRTERAPANVLLTHEGVIPSVHMTRALSCEHVWSDQQRCFVPTLDEWGQTTVPGIFVAGDGASIGGAKAACERGDLVAFGVALSAGKISHQAAMDQAVSHRKTLSSLLRLRPMLDAMYPPRASILTPPDETIVCRCEELTAGDIRKAAAIGMPGPNQLKAFTRAGMGPCQGRQCGYTVANIIAAEQKRTVAEVGLHRIRPPLKPLTLGELASLELPQEK